MPVLAVRSARQGYLVAVAATAVAVLLRAALDGLFTASAPLLPFAAAFLVAGWYGGLRPGLLATGLGALASFFLFMPRVGVFQPERPNDLVRLALFVFLGALASSLCEALHRARRRADRQADLLEHGNDAILGWELGDGIFYWNRAAERLYGFTLQEVMGRAPGELLATAPPVDKLLEELRRDGQWSGDLRQRTKAGGEVAVSTRLALLEADGRLLVMQTDRDVTEQRRAREALRQSEERFRSLAETVPSIVWTAAPDGTIVYVNQRWYDYTGLTAEQNARGWPELVLHPDDYRRCLTEWTAALAEGREYQIEVRNRRHDGAYRWFVTRAVPWRDADGGIAGWYGSTTDIDDQKSQLATVSESEARFRQFADAMPQLTWMARPDGHIYWYNRRWYEYTGTTPEQVEGWGWQSIHDPAVLPAVKVRWQASLDSGEPFEMVFPLKGADGRFRPFLTRVLPLRDLGGRIVQWFGTNTDISEQQSMEAALREADRRKDEFLAVLAHELRNPLAPLRNAVQILGLSDDAAERADALRIMERQLAHMVRLIDDLMDVSRITRGKLRLRLERVELARAVRNTVETARPLFDHRRHRLEVALPAEPLWVDADPARLAQVLGNLLTNAAKYTPPGGRVTLTADRDGDTVVVRVRDTGVGLAAEALPRVFTMFSQVDRSLEHSDGGLGIGLSLVKGLVEMHGGSVEARSEGPGRGSEFVVRLPAAEPPSREGEVGESKAEPAAGGRRVLVVDDNQDAAESLAVMLRLAGHEVRTAHDGLAGVEEAEAFRPDVIFLDIGMPRLNGYDAARRIRELSWGGEVLLIALTGWGQEEDRRRSREAGIDHHLVKPIDPQDLRALIRPR